MKKSLLATSALVGASLAMATPALAAEGKISIGAHTDFHAFAGDLDAADAGRESGFSTESEVVISAENTTSAGLTYGLSIQFEADQDGDNVVDENKVYVKGSFGTAEFGDEDGIEDRMSVKASFGIPGTVNNGTGEATRLDAGLAIKISDSGDSTKINYFTPRINGLQAGITYAPETDSTGDNELNGDTGGQDDFFGFGLNFSQEVQGVSVEVGGVYATSDDDSGSDDFDAYGVGASATFQGVRVAFSYQSSEKDLTLDSDSYGVSVSYSSGPYLVGVAFSDEDSDDPSATAGGSLRTSEQQEYTIGARYSVAPGLSVYISGQIVEREVKDAAGANVTGASGTVDQSGVQAGIQVSF